jgi:hypothetical protein
MREFCDATFSAGLRVLVVAYLATSTRLTKPRPSTEVDRVVARAGVPVSGRDEVSGAYEGVSESAPPGGGGALVAAAPLYTIPRASVSASPTFWWGKASLEIHGLPSYNAPNAFFFLCTRPCLDELGQKLDQLYFQTCPLNARFPDFCVFNPTFSFAFDCFRFQIRFELFDSDLKKFNFDDSASRFPVSTPRSCHS